MIEYLLVFVQSLLLLYFCFFGFYNFLYGFASLYRKEIRTVKLDKNKKVAVVIVSFNEKEVIMDTIKKCEALSYGNKTIIVGDDSNDNETYPLLLNFAKKRGCKQLHDSGFVNHENTEVYESKGFVLFHRKSNEGFKAGNLKELERYLKAKGFDFMYLLDADYWPQKDALERCLEVIEADDSLAYVQTKRSYYHDKMGPLQHCLSLNEEGCYFVDLPGRFAVGDSILFTGCCTLFRLDALYKSKGFRPGHLTEDIDLTNRLYLMGYKAAYLESVGNEGEVPPNYRAYRRQQERWTLGTARTLKDYLFPIIKSRKLNFFEKASLIRQNAYYTTPLVIEVSIVLALVSVFLATGHSDNFAAANYRYVLQFVGLPYTVLLLVALFSNFVPLVITALKKREYHSLFFIPLSTWLSWSLLHTYAAANIRGFLGSKEDWFLTPKTNRKKINVLIPSSYIHKALNVGTLAVLFVVYGIEWWHFGWVDVYAFFWVPALVIGTFLS